MYLRYSGKPRPMFDLFTAPHTIRRYLLCTRKRRLNDDFVYDHTIRLHLPPAREGSMTRTATYSTSVVDKAIDDFSFLDAPRRSSRAYNRTNRTPTRQVPNQLRLRNRELPNVLDDYTFQQIMDIAPDTCLDQAHLTLSPFL